MERQSSLSYHPFLAIKDISLRYGGMDRVALRIDELTIQKGQCVVVCGASGSGKSTFLKLINGLIPEYYPAQVQGSICLQGQALIGMNLEDLSYRVASVFQNPSTQFLHPTVLQDLVFACENQGLAREVIQERLERVQSTFGLTDLLDTRLQDLSGGQKQQVALASATMQGTDLILLDEPTANLDTESIRALQDLLGQLKKEGKTLLIAEHHLAYLSDLADRYLYFKDGHLAIDYPASDFLARTEVCRKDMGLRCYALDLYRKEIAQREAHFRGDLAGLVVDNLTVRQGRRVLHQIREVTLAPGQVVGITGRNGSGKTSLAYYLAGLREDKQARISWQGRTLSARQRLAKTAFVMQEVGLQLFTETVRRELLLAAPEKDWDWDLLDRLGLILLMDRHPASLSGGEQQRLLLAANLFLDRDILILDEPTSGLDLRQMQEVARMIGQLKEAGKLILLISHDEELLAQVTDKIFCIGN